MISVFIADDHAFVRVGIRQVLETAGGIQVVGEASNGRQVLQAARDAAWDVLLLDLSLPGVNGSEVLHRVRALRPQLPVIILSMYPEAHHAPALLAAGAAAYISKDRPAADLVDAIRRVAAAEPPAPPAALPDAPHLSLTAREHQVFLLLVQGLLVAEIAAELDLHSSTVSNHAAHVRAKLGARTLADIIHYAHRHGLVPAVGPT